VRVRLAFAGLLAFAVSPTLPAAPPVAPAPRQKPASKRDHVAELVEKLNAPVEDPIQPNGMTAAQYLAKLVKAQGVEIVLDEEAFKAAGIAEPGKTKLQFQVAKGIRLYALLSVVSAAIQAENEESPERDPRAALIRDGRIVVTVPFAVQEKQRVSGLDEEALDRTFSTTVWVIAEDEPLSAVLRRVAAVYDVNVVVAADAATLAETRITSRILNASLGTAVRALAEQGGLDGFIRHNVILVTLPEKAKELRQVETRMAAEREARFAADSRQALAAQFGVGSLQPSARLVTASPDDKVLVNAPNVRLRAVLDDLTAVGFNITIDPAVGDKVNDPVNLKLNNVSCEAAVKQIAELVGLRAVRMDNSLFVTTSEKADRFAAPAKKPKKMKMP
jgi:hypothetical protein